MRPVTLAALLTSLCIGLPTHSPTHAQTETATRPAQVAPAPAPHKVTLTLNAGDATIPNTEDALLTVATLAMPPSVVSPYGSRNQVVLRGPTGISVVFPLAAGVSVRLGTDRSAPSDPASFYLHLMQPHGKELLDAAVKRIVDALVEQPPIPADELAQRMKDVDQRIAQLEEKLNLLNTMAVNSATIGPEILKERIKAAELEKQRLEMELAAQEARSRAITQQIRRSERQVEESFANDTILKQLRAIVPLREQEVQRVRQLIEQGSANRFELAGAEENVLQAKLRVAEREEALRQTTKTSLLERLNDELATMMINQAEMETRLALIRRQQPSIDVKAIDEQQLNHLTEQYGSLFRNPGALPPLYDELEKKLRALKRERLALRVSDVKVTEG